MDHWALLLSGRQLTHSFLDSKRRSALSDQASVLCPYSYLAVAHAGSPLEMHSSSLCPVLSLVYMIPLFPKPSLTTTVPAGPPRSLVLTVLGLTSI